MSILFISDLHLEESRPDLTQLFLHFLQTQVPQADALYILGDLFEVWLGDDDHSEFNQTIIQALHNISSTGKPVYYMHGNRDFLIGEQFAQQSGCQLLTEPHKLDLYGVPSLLIHGDSLCTKDQAYMQFRQQVRNPQYQQAFLQKSLAERKAIAKQIRDASLQHTHKHAKETIMDATPDEIPRIMLEHGARLLIHGHTHRPSIQHFDLQGQPATRIVLSDWDKYGNVLVCNSQQVYRLESFTLSHQ